jgi:hypothetical protein
VSICVICGQFLRHQRNPRQKIRAFYAKRTQFCAFLAQKQQFVQKTNPIQTQFKANSKPIKPNFSSKTKLQTQNQTQNKPNFQICSFSESPINRAANVTQCLKGGNFLEKRHLKTADRWIVSYNFMGVEVCSMERASNFYDKSGK